MAETNDIIKLIQEGSKPDAVLASIGVQASDLPPAMMPFLSTLFSFIVSVKESVDNNSEQLKALTDQIEKISNLLEAKNNTNSTNSSIPPSKEGLRKPNRKTSLREPSGRKRGAQKGHEGKGLAKVEADITEEENHYPKECLACENLACCLGNMTAMVTGHVYETATVMIDKKHVAYSIVCPKMKKLLKAMMPEEVKSTQQYGKSIKTLITDTWATGITSIKRLADLVEERIGGRISEGTIVKVIVEFAASCSSAISKIREYLIRAAVKGADETGIRTDGILYWLHTVCNEKATYLYADRKRGFKAIEKDGLLLNAEGILVHDCWSSYFQLDNTTHAICLQHIQRELRGAALREKGHEEYFRRLEDFLLGMRKLKNDAIEAGRDCIDEETVQKLRAEYTALIDEGLEIFRQPKRKSILKLGRIPQGKTRSLLLRLKENTDAVFCFIENFDAWFTNNESERSFRVSKVRQSVSKCFRTEKGLSCFAAIMSVLDTAKKNGINRIEMIKAVFDGTADTLLAPVLS